MKRKVMIFALIIFSAFPLRVFAGSENITTAVQISQNDTQQDGENQDETHAEGEEEPPPLWSVIPFVLLLLLIATGPLFFEHFWHKFYPVIAVSLAAIVVFYYLVFLKNTSNPIHAGFEYFQFISLLASLYIASGGIWINVDKKATPRINVAFLAIGAVISNLIGTTGASMLLIRPFMRINAGRIKPFHIVFFIFIVSNIGGSLTPIGDPPLFLGFLKGVPFFWTAQHNFLPWILGVVILCAVFYIFDRKNLPKDFHQQDDTGYSGKISLMGKRNFIWLGVVIVAVFLDPNVFNWVPGIEYHGQKFSFIRELIMLSVAFLSYRYASSKALSENEFSFAPIKEVAYIFIGIFGAMMPALELVGTFAKSPAGTALINHNTLYWGTGILSAFLDNAPTYLNFLAAGMAAKGAGINQLADVRQFAEGGFPDSVLMLLSISIAAVFFGALTYIGNGPNFMVKAISEERGIHMPSFFGYMIRFSIPILLPLLVLVWLVFFAFQSV